MADKNPRISISAFFIFLMVATSFMPLASVTGDIVTNFKDLGGNPTSEVQFVYPDAPTTGQSATFSLPNNAVVKSASMNVSSKLSGEKHFVDFRERKDPAISYTGNEYKKFDQGGAVWDSTEVTVSKADVRLKEYRHDLHDAFTDYTYIDNGTTTANLLVDDGGFDQRVVINRDNSVTYTRNGDTGNKKTSVSGTHFYDGRLLKSATITVWSSCSWCWGATTANIKGFLPASQSWITLYDNQNLPSSMSGTVVYNQAWGTPTYSAIQVKIGKSWSWGDDQVRYTYSFGIQGFQNSAVLQYKNYDLVPNQGWGPGWSIKNATINVANTLGTGGNANVPVTGTTMEYYLSNNGGNDWVRVYNMTTQEFSTSGRILKFKALFTTTNKDVSPDIWDLKITYTRRYTASANYTSLFVQAPRDWPITSIKPIINSTPAPDNFTDDRRILLEVTNDGGTTWKSVNPNMTVYFPFTDVAQITTNKNVGFKATLISSGAATPILYNITVYYEISMYPIDPKIKMDQFELWTYDGIFFEDKETTIGGIDFVNELNKRLPHVGTGTTEITLNLTSTSAGALVLNDLNIDYGLPPFLIGTGIPDIHIDEDSGTVANKIDLLQYFNDDGGKEALIFELTFKEDPSSADAFLSDDAAHRYLSFVTKKENFTGELRFQVRATDRDDLKTPSNSFILYVDNIEDPPVIYTIPDQTLYVEETFRFQVNIFDADPEESFTYKTDNPSIGIDAKTGLIEFIPSLDMVRAEPYIVTVTVTDAHGGSASTKAAFTIKKINTAPSLEHFKTSETMYAGDQWQLQLKGSDPDLMYGDVLAYSMEKPNGKPVSMTMTPEGLVTWTPGIEDINAQYRITFRVTDSEGASDFATVVFSVFQENTAPRDLNITTNPATDFKANEEIMFTASASDNDRGDVVTFAWYLKDGAQEKLLATTASFKTAFSSDGSYTLTVKVNDGHTGHEVSKSVTVTVAGTSEDTVTPGPTTAPEEKTDQVMGMDQYLFYLYVLVGIVIGVIVVSTVWGQFPSKIKQKKKSEDEVTETFQAPKGKGPQEGLGPEAAPAPPTETATPELQLEQPPIPVEPMMEQPPMPPQEEGGTPPV